MKIIKLIVLLLAFVIGINEIKAKNYVFLGGRSSSQSRRPRGNDGYGMVGCKYEHGYIYILFTSTVVKSAVVSVKDIDGFEIAGYCVNATETIPFYIGEITEDVHITVTTDTGRTYQGWLNAE